MDGADRSEEGLEVPEGNEDFQKETKRFFDEKRV